VERLAATPHTGLLRRQINEYLCQLPRVIEIPIERDCVLK
jgi:hypothetical protein